MLFIAVLLTARVFVPPAPPAAPPATETAPAATNDAAQALQADDKMSVVVMASQGVDAELGGALSSVMAQALGDVGAFRAVAQSELSSMLDYEAQRQEMGCSEGASCLAEVVGALGADYVVSSRVVAAGDLFVLQLELIEIAKAQVIARESRDVEGKSKLFEAARGAVRVLVQGLLETRAGTLVVEASESDATVRVDRRIVGVTPMEPLAIGAGTHSVSIEKEGFITASVDVEVKPAQPVTATLVLRPSTEYRSAYERGAWGVRIAAVSVAGAGVASLLASGVMFALALGTADAVRADTEAYNAGARTQAEYDAVLAQRRTLGGLEAGFLSTAIAAPVLIGAGVVVFFVGPDPGRYAEAAE